VGDFERYTRAGGGWGCWSFSNHDCVRVVTRWGREFHTPAFPKVLLAVLGSLRGSFCVYQGEELGLPEAEVPFERLIDPYGITFWPDFKGRDGCRTPMPWTQEAPWGGFSTVEPWLPMDGDHLHRAVSLHVNNPGSVLHFFLKFLRWRHHLPALRHGAIRFLKTEEPVLAFERTHKDQRLIVAFNLGPYPSRLLLPAGVNPLKGHGLEEARIEGRQLLLPPWGGFFGQVG